VNLKKLAFSLLVASAACFSGPTPTRAATELWPVTTGNNQPVPFANVMVQAVAGPLTNNGNGYAVIDSFPETGDSNGLVTMTNLLIGTFIATATGPYQDLTPVTFTITNFNSTNYVTQNSSVATNLPGAANSYSMYASDGRYVHQPWVDGVANYGWAPLSTNPGAAYAWMPQAGGGGGSVSLNPTQLYLNGGGLVTISNNATTTNLQALGVLAATNISGGNNGIVLVGGSGAIETSAATTKIDGLLSFPNNTSFTGLNSGGFNGTLTGGSFSGPLTGNVTGNVTGSAGSFTGSLAGDVTGTQSATVVGHVGGVTAANVASGANAANAATSTDTPSTIVARDSSGSFSGSTITAANFSGNGSALTSLTAGNLTAGGTFPAENGSALTSLTAGNLTSGGTFPAENGSALTSLTGANVTGYVPDATFATTAGGAPPTGSAGGTLAGSYPNPILTPNITNTVSATMSNITAFGFLGSNVVQTYGPTVLNNIQSSSTSPTNTWISSYAFSGTNGQQIISGPPGCFMWTNLLGQLEPMGIGWSIAVSNRQYIFLGPVAGNTNAMQLTGKLQLSYTNQTNWLVSPITFRFNDLNGNWTASIDGGGNGMFPFWQNNGLVLVGSPVTNSWILNEGSRFGFDTFSFNSVALGAAPPVSFASQAPYDSFFVAPDGSSWFRNYLTNAFTGILQLAGTVQATSYSSGFVQSSANGTFSSSYNGVSLTNIQGTNIIGPLILPGSSSISLSSGATGYTNGIWFGTNNLGAGWEMAGLSNVLGKYFMGWWSNSVLAGYLDTNFNYYGQSATFTNNVIVDGSMTAGSLITGSGGSLLVGTGAVFTVGTGSDIIFSSTLNSFGIANTGNISTSSGDFIGNASGVYALAQGSLSTNQIAGQSSTNYPFPSAIYNTMLGTAENITITNLGPLPQGAYSIAINCNGTNVIFSWPTNCYFKTNGQLVVTVVGTNYQTTITNSGLFTFNVTKGTTSSPSTWSSYVQGFGIVFP
jgi:hypothetical protein